MNIIKTLVKDIKDLKIQGATNVAKAALSALAEDIRISKYQDIKILREKKDELARARPTEPLTKNCLNYILWQIETLNDLNHLKKSIDLLLSRLADVQKEIGENGVRFIKNGMSILTHCHSTTVEEILKKAFKNGLDFQVYLTETRPRFQGRITAQHLLKAGLKVTMITDSQVSSLLSRKEKREIDFVILGTDGINPDGSCLNKVGSYGISLAAKENKIPLYVVGTLFKFSPQPLPIEERAAEEVWEKKPEKLKILNPAFDLIPAEFITGYITEFGTVKPEMVLKLVKQNYPWIIKPRADLRSGTGAKLKLKSPYLFYLHLEEMGDPKNHIIATFYLESGADFLETAGGVAAESSVGTWTEVKKSKWQQLHARVLEADENSGFLKIAYPLDLFESGNIPQLLSSVAGNIYGLRQVKHLKLLDLEMPEVYVQSFPGPQIGADGVRKISAVWERPLIGSIIKPKEGLDWKQHTQVALEVFEGGGDLVKDDENLTSQVFNPFEKRVLEITQQMKEKKFLSKIYAFNITAEAETMKKRAEFVKIKGGNCLMIDILTVGFSAVSYIRKQNYGLIIHGHRAGHGAFTRDPKQGISMLVLAKLARLSGIDQLHTGTVVGKMKGGKQEVITVNKFLLSDWYGLKKVLPVASGGLYPALIPDLVKILGRNVILNFGGGIHGHPQGSKAGVVAVRQALEAVEKKIPLKVYAKNHSELAISLKNWPREISDD